MPKKTASRLCKAAAARVQEKRRRHCSTPRIDMKEKERTCENYHNLWGSLPSKLLNHCVGNSARKVQVHLIVSGRRFPSQKETHPSVRHCIDESTNQRAFSRIACSAKVIIFSFRLFEKFYEHLFCFAVQRTSNLCLKRPHRRQSISA